jgi:hypothetical protein
MLFINAMNFVTKLYDIIYIVTCVYSKVTMN